MEKVNWICSNCGFKGTNKKSRYCPMCGKDRPSSMMHLGEEPSYGL